MNSFLFFQEACVMIFNDMITRWWCTCWAGHAFYSDTSWRTRKKGKCIKGSERRRGRETIIMIIIVREDNHALCFFHVIHPQPPASSFLRVEQNREKRKGWRREVSCLSRSFTPKIYAHLSKKRRPEDETRNKTKGRSKDKKKHTCVSPVWSSSSSSREGI